MHILLLHQYFLEDDAGGGSRWNEMCRLWKAKGHDVTVLAGSVHYMGGTLAAKNGSSYNRNGINVIRCPVATGYGGGFWARSKSYFSFAWSAILKGIWDADQRYDRIVVTSPPLFIGIAALVLSWVKRVPYVFEVRDLWPESAIDTGILSNPLLIRAAFWFESLVYRKAEGIVVLTPAFRSVLTEQKHVPPHKVRLIPNAADFTISDQVMTNFDSDAFRKELVPEGRCLLIYVGAHGIANHLTQLLDAAEILQDTEAFFLLIGDGPEKESLVNEARRRKLNNIRFLPPVSKSEIFKYILCSDIGISVLKRAEIFKTVYSNKTFDYFACKKPVLMAIDGISRTLVEDADAGVFVEPENPRDFAEKVRNYLAHPGLARTQGEKGYRYARTHFDRVKFADDYLDYLSQISDPTR